MSDQEKKPGGAPAVVGEIKVSDELLDFTSFKTPKKAEAKCEPCKQEIKKGELTPREKAIMERLAKKAKAE